MAETLYDLKVGDNVAIMESYGGMETYNVVSVLNVTQAQIETKHPYLERGPNIPLTQLWYKKTGRSVGHLKGKTRGLSCCLDIATHRIAAAMRRELHISAIQSVAIKLQYQMHRTSLSEYPEAALIAIAALCENIELICEDVEESFCKNAAAIDKCHAN